MDLILMTFVKYEAKKFTSLNDFGF